MKGFWKRKLPAILLSAVLLCGTAAPVQAAEVWERNTVSYRNIEEVVEGSLDFAGTASQINGVISSLEEAQKGLNQISQALEKQIPQNPQDPSYLTLYALKTNTDLLNAQIGMSLTSYRESRNQITQAKDQVVVGLNTLYITYNTLSDQRDEVSRSLRVYDKTLEAYRLQYELGMITKLELDQMEENRAVISGSIDTIDLQLKNMRRTFNTTIGRNYNRSLSIGSLPSPDLKYVEEINFGDDVEYVVDSYGSGDTFVSNSEKYDEYKGSNAAALRRLYENIGEKQRLLEQEERALELESRSLEASKLQAELGTISQLQLVAAQDQYDTQAAAVKTAKTNLFTAIEQYRWMVDYGYISS